MTTMYDFGVRAVPPCGDCYEDGHCSMNCSGPGCPGYPAGGSDPCKECNGLTYVLREFGEIACPECQPDMYAEQINDIWLGY